jgi:hypothetical protein
MFHTWKNVTPSWLKRGEARSDRHAEGWQGVDAGKIGVRNRGWHLRRTTASTWGRTAKKRMLNDYNSDQVCGWYGNQPMGVTRVADWESSQDEMDPLTLPPQQQDTSTADVMCGETKVSQLILKTCSFRANCEISKRYKPEFGVWQTATC